MWTRYLLKCNNCNKITNLRVAIEGSPQQEIKIYCGYCKSVIGGQLKIDYKNTSHSFEPKGCIQTNENFNGGDYFIEYAEGLPVSKPNIEGHSILSPFMRMMMQTEDKDDFFIRHKLEQVTKDEDWYNIENFNRAFLNNDQSLLKTIIKKYKITNDPKELDEQLYKILFETNLYFYHPFLNIYEFKKNEKLINDYLNARVGKDSQSNFVDYLNDNHIIFDWFGEIFDDFQLFNQNRKKFRPIIYSPDLNENQKLIDEHISNESFLNIRNIYTNIFETLGRLISLFHGFDNIDERDDYNVPKTSYQKRIKKWDDFLMIDNGQKMNYLSNNPLWKAILDDNFDNKLRNGINHNKARINSDSQLISYFPRKTGNKEYTISYYSFMKKTVRSFQSLFTIFFLITRILDIYY